MAAVFGEASEDEMESWAVCLIRLGPNVGNLDEEMLAVSVGL